MTRKHLICPEKVRRVPKQFSWIDHRLVRDHYIEGLSHAALALYLLLATVGDRKGLSYYSDRSIGSLLAMDLPILTKAREELIRAGLLAYQKPLYQVLSLEPVKTVSSSELAPIASILKQIAGGQA